MNALRRWLKRLTAQAPIYTINDGDDAMLRVRPYTKLPLAVVSDAEVVKDFREGVARRTTLCRGR